ncbi:hypothetical protein HPP92_025466 [Vanilla planifolia]|uniref:RING-type E3 ubiquitin transferase n=1 Tax=Vanilla planifolia TaxID=51239 RepID=A0A835UA88_VANPL|nr:hypothetical protein HPP92_025466 [Vanilla planifolia]
MNAIWLRLARMNSVFRHRTPHELLHHNDYTLFTPGMHLRPAPLHLATSTPAEIDDYYSSGEEEEEELRNAMADSYRSRGSGLSRETVTGYLKNVAGCSESEEICTICQVRICFPDPNFRVRLIWFLTDGDADDLLKDDIHADKERTKLRCGHIFHFGCIEDWLMVKNECPVCRAAAVPLRDGTRRQ